MEALGEKALDGWRSLVIKRAFSVVKESFPCLDDEVELGKAIEDLLEFARCVCFDLIVFRSHTDFG